MQILIQLSLGKIRHPFVAPPLFRRICIVFSSAWADASDSIKRKNRHRSFYDWRFYDSNVGL